jgi:sugar phosphate isomerase/epimerase
VPGGIALDGQPAIWRKALEETQFPLVTVFCGYPGESYADIPAVQRTVGFVPSATRAERERRILEVSDFAAELGVGGIGCHVGLIPAETSDPEYKALVELVRRVCDHAARNSQTFALETGHEGADELFQFLSEVGRPNVGINFDPANMIMYGTGDPITALGVLAERVVSVHCKDGQWPPKETPDALGPEMPLGEGAVGIEQFVAKLKQVGYTGPLCIEREIEDPEQWRADLASAVQLLERTRAGV